MKLGLLLLMCVTLASAARVARWVNNYDKPFTFRCPSHHSIGTVTSNHDNKHEDRVWDFNCKNTFSKAATCSWSGDVNHFDKQFQYLCPNGAVISGMGSYHDNKKEDRRWKYLCCFGEKKVQKNCKWTNYVNDFDKYLKWNVPSDRFLVGVDSYHDNKKEDRRWRYYTCQKS
ncbi:hemagglutinin/amebocyte aggregation factor-like [Engystomops pustulosus]|uniref:hemagglutinin/amebocyte aggregation factor-like n=1 Tax=Engystomops pustulosus TaxID=76066 RepID=UPI003AFB2662